MLTIVYDVHLTNLEVDHAACQAVQLTAWAALRFENPTPALTTSLDLRLRLYRVLSN